MPEVGPYDSGFQAREYLRGLLQVGGPTYEWGPRIDAGRLKDLYAPQKIKPFTATPGGIDNLALTSTDEVLVPGRGEFEIKFKGYFRVARADPTTNDWATAETYVNMIDLFLEGSLPGIGGITVRLNPDFVSPGQVLAPGGPGTTGKCRIAAAALFDVPGMSILFNKEPILLMNNGIRSIPPVEDPNGVAHLYYLPLYSHGNPSGRPVAYVTRLEYTVGNYITKAQAIAFRKRAQTLMPLPQR